MKYSLVYLQTKREKLFPDVNVAEEAVTLEFCAGIVDNPVNARDLTKAWPVNTSKGSR